MTFGSVKLTCARRYTDFAKMQNPRYFKPKFSTVGYENVSVTSLVATAIKSTQNSKLETQNCYNLAGQKVSKD